MEPSGPRCAVRGQPRATVSEEALEREAGTPHGHQLLATGSKQPEMDSTSPTWRYRGACNSVVSRIAILETRARVVVSLRATSRGPPSRVPRWFGLQVSYLSGHRLPTQEPLTLRAGPWRFENPRDPA